VQASKLNFNHFQVKGNIQDCFDLGSEAPIQSNECSWVNPIHCCAQVCSWTIPSASSHKCYYYWRWYWYQPSTNCRKRILETRLWSQTHSKRPCWLFLDNFSAYRLCNLDLCFRLLLFVCLASTKRLRDFVFLYCSVSHLVKYGVFS